MFMEFIILFKPKMAHYYWEWRGKDVCSFQKYVQETIGIPEEEAMSFIKEILIIDPSDLSDVGRYEKLKKEGKILTR